MGTTITLICPKLAANETLKDGIKFTSKKILQWAVIILGFSLNLGTIAAVGAKSLPVIVCTITTSLLVGMLMMKVLHMDKRIACLIGVGSSICGGSAIAATAPVIDAKDEEVAQSISVIFLFNVLAALIFPYLGHAIGLGTEGFAVFAGTAVNDTSSVTAAASTAEGNLWRAGILSAAVTVKLTGTSGDHSHYADPGINPYAACKKKRRVRLKEDILSKRCFHFLSCFSLRQH